MGADGLLAGDVSARVPLPPTEHIDTEFVYSPSEDTFLLLDVLASEAPALRAGAPRCALELGPGSGVVIATLATLLCDEDAPASCVFFAVDINPRACSTTQQSMEIIGKGRRRVDVVNGDLLRCMRPRLQGCVDILIFNPPYVPTPPEEVLEGGLAAAWAGGDDGRQVLDRALGDIAAVLAKPHGVAYVIVERANRPVELAALLREKHGLDCVAVASRRARNERLSVLKLFWPPEA
jgi:release factor glutamine methyltransferase